MYFLICYELVRIVCSFSYFVEKGQKFQKLSNFSNSLSPKSFFHNSRNFMTSDTFFIYFVKNILISSVPYIVPLFARIFSLKLNLRPRIINWKTQLWEKIINKNFQKLLITPILIRLVDILHASDFIIHFNVMNSHFVPQFLYKSR